MQILDYIHALPDSYEKGEKSNNYKLLSLEHRLVERFREDIDAVQETLDIYRATGKTLDNYGSIYGQARGSMTDEQYRYAITQKAARYLVDGSVNGVAEALAVAFGVSASLFGIRETENTCEVEITDLPFSVLQKAGLTVSQIHQIIAEMLPSGVKLAPLNFEGTFTFAATADEHDPLAGFGNIEQTTGGYFGYLSTDNVVIPT